MKGLRLWLGSACVFCGGTVSFGANALDEFEFPPPPPPCVEVNASFQEGGCEADFATSDVDFCFTDRVPEGSSYPNGDGADGQITVRGDQAQGVQDCGIVLVKETGYYAIFDSELSESCADQVDETGYLTVHNACNMDGWAVERNVGDRYLVLDADNEGAGCEQDSECAAEHVCREGNSHGRCCVPDEPVYMGTYLLVAGEENVICIHHWCPEWEEALADGEDLGYISTPGDAVLSCSSPDSIHFKIAATAVVCKQQAILQACAGGCDAGECLPHPCFEADCPAFCQQGSSGAAECLQNNPCEGTDCEFGCVFGLCLQGSGARGADADGDGYSVLADCDDNNAAVHPGTGEVDGNGIDDDCDGFVDAALSFDGGIPPVDSGVEPEAGADSGGIESTTGCGCGIAGLGSAGLLGLPSLLALMSLRRLRRRRTTGR